MNAGTPGNIARELFARPFVLAFLLLLVPLCAAWIFRERKLRAASFPPFSSFRFFLSGLFFWIFAACSVIALAGPRWGVRYVEDYRRGLDVVLAFDVSRSMEVRDADGGGRRVSRLESGAAAALETAAACTGVRFAAALGRGGGILAVPLTWDGDVIRAFLEGLLSSPMSGRGTNLEALVDAASGAFESGFPGRRIIVLVSDGEALSGSLSGALDRAAAKDIAIAALAAGTAEGGPVPDLMDGEGGAVYSRRRDDVMRHAALRTGGIFVDGNRRDAAALLSGYLLSNGGVSSSGGRRRETRSREDLFAVLALVFLGASKACVLCRRGNLSVLLAWGLLVSVFLFPSCSRVPGKLLVLEGNMYSRGGRYAEAEAAYTRALVYEDALPYAEYGLGAACIARDEKDAALEHFAAAAAALEKLPENRELSYRLKYNSGLALFGKGDYAAAAAAFRDALKTDGGRVAAKRNLELSLLSMREDNKEKSAPEKGGETPESDPASLFDYLRGREKIQWESREWPEEDPSTPGY
ncbi:MAG: hypothetical protein LBK08_09360 [Treponema sp.]|jgi:Ca-activated chloride channel family protein|nr:hypothetical protein [Treponema sp.]